MVGALVGVTALIPVIGGDHRVKVDIAPIRIQVQVTAGRTNAAVVIVNVQALQSGAKLFELVVLIEVAKICVSRIPAYAEERMVDTVEKLVEIVRSGNLVRPHCPADVFDKKSRAVFFRIRNQLSENFGILFHIFLTGHGDNCLTGVHGHGRNANLTRKVNGASRLFEIESAIIVAHGVAEGLVALYGDQLQRFNFSLVFLREDLVVRREIRRTGKISRPKGNIDILEARILQMHERGMQIAVIEMKNRSVRLRKFHKKPP